MIAYIPARGGSKRIPRKNIKLLVGRPVLARVIEVLKSLEFVEKVCVSTDDLEIQKIAIQSGAETGELRAKELSDDYVDFITLIGKDVPRFACDSEDILFALPTAALIQKKHYCEAFEIYKKSSPQLLMAVVDYLISPLWAMQQGTDGFWKPLHPEAIRKRSQDLPRTCTDAGLFHFMKWKVVKKFKTLMVDRLLAYHVSHDIAVDVDTLEDWVCLEKLYQ
jgi:CMP-N-acetylneuraminic acid synthetase